MPPSCKFTSYPRQHLILSICNYTVSQKRPTLGLGIILTYAIRLR